MSFFGINSTNPNQNVNSDYANVSSSNNPSFFGSNETNTCYKGGKRTKTKIKNIYRMYKMKTTRRKRTARKIRLMKKYGISRRRKPARHSTRRKMRGGYSQYQSNVPFTANYSTGGILNSHDSALANPVPYMASSSCFDNYNHYTGK
jgi:hypothetical protein